MYEFALDLCINNDIVVCANCALSRCGLTTQSATPFDVYTTYKNLCTGHYGYFRYFYNENIDYENYIKKSNTNPHILVPTPERALVEVMKNKELVDEGTLIEALMTYQSRKSICDMSKLYEVADFYGLSRDIVDYWWKEAEEEEWY